MATINIGSLTFTHKGDYASGTAYVKNDVVYYSTNGNAYIAKTSTTGNAPTSTAHWDLFAAGSGGIWNAGLSLGTAGQAVKVNSAGNALEFGTISSGAFSIAEFKSFNMQTETHSGSTHTSYRLSSGSGTLTITPTATTDLLHFNFTMNVEGTLGGYYGQAIGMQTSNSGWTSTTGDAMLVINLGEHAQGMGSGNDTERYQHLVLNKMVTASDLGMSAGTTYHFVPYILCHNPAGQIKTAKDASNSNNIGHGRFEIMRYTAN